MSFNIDRIIDSLEIEILLSDKADFEIDLRFTAKVKDHYKTFESGIKAYSDIKILRWRNLTVSGMKLGLPSRIMFNRDFIYRIRPELKKIKKSFNDARLVGKEIKVEEYIEKNFSLCKKHHEFLCDSVEIASYIITNRDKIKGLYPRQISHGKSTKLFLDIPLVKGILSNYFNEYSESSASIFEFLGLRRKPVPFHFYASELEIRGSSVTNFYGAINEINKEDFSFDCKNTIIVENEESFISLTEVVQDSLVIFGGGWKVAALSPLIDTFPGTIYYWGDLDHEGIEILNHVSTFLPNIIPVAMSEEALKVFSALVQKDTTKKPNESVKILLELYRLVCVEGKRIEQEQLPVDYVLAEIEKIT